MLRVTLTIQDAVGPGEGEAQIVTGLDKEARSAPTQVCPINFLQRAKAVQGRKNGLFNKYCLSNWTSVAKKMNLDLSLTPNTKQLKIVHGIK